MIRIVDRHIARSALGGMALALVTLLTLDLFLALISEIKDVKNDYAVLGVFQYLLLSVPRRIITLFPVAAAVGVLLGVGGMSANAELVAYRSAGVSRLRIGLAAVWAVTLAIIPVMLMAEWLAPSSERLAEGLKSRGQNSGVTVTRNASLWVRDGDRIIHANKPLAGSLAADQALILADIDVFVFDADKLQELSHAEKAIHDGQQWVLSNVRSSYLSPERVTVATDAVQYWPSLIDPENLKSAISRPGQLAIRELNQYIRYLKQNQLDAIPYEAARWRRLAYPLKVVAIVIASLPFVFGFARSGSMGQRLFIGVLLGLGLHFMSSSVSDIGEVYRWPPVISELLPALVVFALGVWWLRRGP